jgi:co-chaperonin GroES (HSP10)
MDLTRYNTRLLRGQLLGRIIEGNYETESGILVVDSLKKKKPGKVHIMAIGTRDEIIPMKGVYFLNGKDELEAYAALPGDFAFIKMSEGKKILIEGRNCLILENKDIVAVGV